MIFSKTYDNLKVKFETFLSSLFSLDNVPSPLKESMLYAIEGGGKRIRPVLFLYTYSICKEIDETALLFASALEVLHNYSLVHDDLPCMDNDDYRRGKLTVHKKFGQDVAVLCGDALLNLAYEIVAKALKSATDKTLAIKCFDEFAQFSSAQGMIAGQTVDVSLTKALNMDTLDYIYKNKTCNLFCYSLKGASILAGNQNYEDFAKLGYLLGYLFQLTDDLLDNDDAFSVLKIMKKSQAEQLLEDKKKEALLLSEKLDANGFFTKLIYSIVERKN